MPAPTGPVYNGGNRQQSDHGWENTTVVLEKSSAKQGFGIAISGGRDNPHFSTGDVSIIVSDIVKGSPADGTLRIGDTLISVNERLVDGGTHHDAVQALKAAGMQARMEIKRPGPPKPKATKNLQEPADSSTPKGSPKTDGDRGRPRKKPRDMENESGERHRSSRSRSRNREEGENGEKPKRSRSRSKGEDGDKPRRSRSKQRSEGGEEGDKPRRSRSRNREEGGEEGDKPRRSRSKLRDEGEGTGAAERKSRGRSKSRSRDDLTRSKSKESLHRSKSRENINGLPSNAERHTIVLDRGPQGYGFSLGLQVFIRDFAKESPAAKAENLDKGDIVYEINGTRVDNLKISECIEIIKGATEQLTLTIIKKPKESKDQIDKPKSKPTRPAEAPEAEVIPKAESHPPKEEKAPKPQPRPEPVERKRDASPVHSHNETKASHNETQDSWAAASPEKRSYSSEEGAHQPSHQPNQEMENMDDKIRRLKARPKLERRLSQLPHARVISFKKTGSVGIQVAGGNSVGIYVAAIRDNSAAATAGLKTGDQIIMCNEIDFEDITREEAVLILLALPDDVSLVVESKYEQFKEVKKELGDNFFIRANFDHMDKANGNELTFRKGEIFNVRDTMYQGLIGFWQAQRVGKNGKLLERGTLPNKSRAEQLALAQRMEEKQSGRPKSQRKGSLGGTLKKQKFESQDHLDASSFADAVQIPAYERVVLKVADFMRPVVILGALADLFRLALLEEMPDRFDVPTPIDVAARSYDSDLIKLSEIRNVVAKNKHCLLDTTPEGIEMLMYAQLCPIVILLKTQGMGAVKETRVALTNHLKGSPTGVPGFVGDPLKVKQVKKIYNNAKKLEEFYPHIFTAKLNTHIQGDAKDSRGFYNKARDIIFTQQSQSAWMPEERPEEMLDDMVFHPPNYLSYTSGADSDTEGESTTSSPVLTKRHFDDEVESPLPSPTDDSAFSPPVVEDEPKKHRRERSKDRKQHRDDSSDGERRRSRHDKSKSSRHEKKEDETPEFKLENPPYREDYREPPRQDHESPRQDREPPRHEREPPRHERESPRHEREPPRHEREPQREPPRQDYPDDYRNDYRDAPREDSRDYQNDYRQPPRNQEKNRDYRDDYRGSPKQDRYNNSNDYRGDYREPPRDKHRDYRDPPVEERISVQQQNNVYAAPENGFTYGSGPQEPEVEDVPVLLDPNYELPKPIPDSPPSRHPPEVKPKPSSNAIRVFPNELRNVQSMEEKRRSLKRVPDYDANPLQDYDDRAGVKVSDVYDIEHASNSPKRQEPSDDLPPYRPPPPAQENIPEKVMTLQERMNKFQKKVTQKPSPPEEDDLPPARPAAPRNYIIDTRNRGSPRQDLYAQNTYKPSAQFAQVTRVAPRSQEVEEPYVNIREASQVKSTPESSYPGYDYVKPHNTTQKHTRSPSPGHHDYDYPRSPRDYNQTTEDDPHYRHPPPSRNDGYSVPPPRNDGYNVLRTGSPKKSNVYDEEYPPYQLPRTNQTAHSNGHDSREGEDEPRVIATARGMFDHRGGLLESTETNVSIYIPAGALPEGRKQEVYFKVCQDSKYMPPLDSHSGETLLSPLVMCGPHGLKFRKPIELRLPHKGASNDSMAFSLKSSDSPVGHPGHWKNVKLGGKDLDSGRAYQVTDDTVSVLVDHF